MQNLIQEQINKHQRLKKVYEDTKEQIRIGLFVVELLSEGEEKIAQRRRGELRLQEQEWKARFSAVMILVFMNYNGKKDKKYNERLGKELTDASQNWIANMEEQAASKWEDWNENDYLELCQRLKEELEFVNMLTKRY